MNVTNRKVGQFTVETVSSREVHAMSKCPTFYPSWVAYRIKKMGLKEGKDYVLTVSEPYGQKDYHVSPKNAIEMAKDSHDRWNSVATVSYLRGLVPQEEVQVVTTVARQPVFSAPAHLSDVKTMSSVEIVEVINQLRPAGRAELRHADFLEKVRTHPGINERNFSFVYSDPKGEKRPCYYLPKREAELMVMSESLEVQTKVYDRLAEFEAAAAVMKLPQTYAQALMELALTVQKTEALQLENVTKTAQIEQQTVLIEAQKPAVEFVEQYVSSDSLKGFRTVARLLNANEREFRNFLVDRKFQFYQDGAYTHYARYDVKDGGAGYFDTKTGVTRDSQRTYMKSCFTPKGVTWITRLWNERVPMLTKKAPKIDESLYKLN